MNIRLFRSAILPICSLIVSIYCVEVHAQETSSLPSKVSPGDKLTIKVLEQESLCGSYTVFSNGTLGFPLIPEDVNVKGLTHDEIAQKLKEELEKECFYKATVLVRTYKKEDAYTLRSTRRTREGKGIIYVYGMVGSPGVLNLPDDEALTVSKVIIRKGGFQDFANRGCVKIFRKNPATGKVQTIKVNVANVIEKGKLDQDVAVQDGDMIVVPEQFFNF
ncbi:MAG: polysaccharide biosynthesis/export family protein [Candidatus Omnitrophica bacterium]|nr:polysaccharide biosynthesis/export family protein [Candidatus Omnitrophota bacterium]